MLGGEAPAGAGSRRCACHASGRRCLPGRWTGDRLGRAASGLGTVSGV